MTTSAIPFPHQGFATSSVLAGRHVRRSLEPREPIEASASMVRSFTLDLADGSVTVEITGEEPDWLYKVLDNFQDLSFLPVGWDSYDGGPVTFDAAFAGLRFLARMLLHDSPIPSVVPTSSGGLQFEWHRSVGDLEVYVSRDGRIGASFASASGDESWEIEAIEAEGMDLALLYSVVTRL